MNENQGALVSSWGAISRKEGEALKARYSMHNTRLQQVLCQTRNDLGSVPRRSDRGNSDLIRKKVALLQGACHDTTRVLIGSHRYLCRYVGRTVEPQTDNSPQPMSDAAFDIVALAAPAG